MALRVIGAGLGRTGTTSLKAALEELLDAPCYHMGEVSKRDDDPTVWADAYEGRFPAWEGFFGEYCASVDWPSAPFWPQLADAFPDAVIVLSVRDADQWWRSVSSTIFPAMADAYFSPDSKDDDWTRMCRGMMAAFSAQWQEESAAKAAYLAYNNHVRATAPADRLVEWSAGDGWGPLCEALELEQPGHAFPHLNRTADARAEMGMQEL
jgi:Sulfotransferase domain